MSPWNPIGSRPLIRLSPLRATLLDPGDTQPGQSLRVSGLHNMYQVLAHSAAQLPAL